MKGCKVVPAWSGGTAGAGRGEDSTGYSPGSPGCPVGVLSGDGGRPVVTQLTAEMSPPVEEAFQQFGIEAGCCFGKAGWRCDGFRRCGVGWGAVGNLG